MLRHHVYRYVISRELLDFTIGTKIVTPGTLSSTWDFSPVRLLLQGMT
jgi:hypothetical protein